MSKSPPPEDAIFTVAVLIDELKHEEAPRRLESMRHLATIAEALGPERTRNELLPFLGDSLDDDDEVLLELATQLGNFVALVGGPAYATTLLSSLEALAMVEESAVRDRSMASIIKISKELSDAFVVEHVMHLLRTLATKEWFTARISACSLFASVYTRVPPPLKAELRSKFAALAKDDTPMVRRAAAAALPAFSAAVEPEHVRSELTPLFLLFAEDEQDSVRLLAIQSAAALARLVGTDGNDKTVKPTTLKLAADKSWRVRWSVASSFCDVCEGLAAAQALPASSHNDLLDAFLALLRDHEAEVRTAAATNITRTSKLFPITSVLQHFMVPIADLVNDPAEHVREALASVLMGMAPVVGKDKAIENLLPHYNALLRDESAKVRLAIVAKLGTTGGIVGVEHIQTALLPAIVDLSNDKNWRVRAEIIQHIPVLATQLDVGFFDKNLADLCVDWLTDNVAAIRTAAVANIIRLTGVYGKDWAKNKVVPKLAELKKSQQYLYRQSAIRMAEALGPTLDAGVVESTLVPFITSLATDPVPNVRFNVAKSLERMAAKLGDGKGEMKKCLKGMVNDADVDVTYYAKRALSAVG